MPSGVEEAARCSQTPGPALRYPTGRHREGRARRRGSFQGAGAAHADTQGVQARRERVAPGQPSLGGHHWQGGSHGLPGSPVGPHHLMYPRGPVRQAPSVSLEKTQGANESSQGTEAGTPGDRARVQIQTPRSPRLEQHRGREAPRRTHRPPHGAQGTRGVPPAG